MIANGHDPNYASFATPTATPIDPPLVVADPDQYKWDDECDMLVVGYGLAGASAALKAAELGHLDIILADRFDGGGTSALSGGVVYAGGGTRVQRQLGIADSPEGLANYLQKEVGALRRPDTIRRFAESSPQMIDWLEARGVRFDGPVATKKTSYPPAHEFLYYSGNEKSSAYADINPPAPRGHRARSTDPRDEKKFSGQVLMNGLKRTIAGTPAIRPKFQSSARRLILDAEGRVVGAELWQLPQGGSAALRHQFFYDRGKRVLFTILGLTSVFWKRLAQIERKHAVPIRVRARRGVVLSTGGFVHNRPMVEQAAKVFAHSVPAGGPGDDGSAIKLGQGAGARLRQMHLLSPWRFISPPMSWIKGVLVSKEGVRLVNEELYGARLGDAIFENADGKAWLITDAKVQAAGLHELNHDPLWAFQKLPGKFAAMRATRASDIATLETKLGFPKASLVACIETYNAGSRNKADALGKSPDNCAVLETGPFYAMDMSWDAKMNPIGAITLGGLDIDEDNGAVLNLAGERIPGLFAAGRSAVGICSENYVSGLSLADCVWSGWVAAQAVAGNMPAAAG